MDANLRSVFSLHAFHAVSYACRSIPVDLWRGNFEHKVPALHAAAPKNKVEWPLRFHTCASAVTKSAPEGRTSRPTSCPLRNSTSVGQSLTR